jgi:hypothetical protein
MIHRHSPALAHNNKTNTLQQPMIIRGHTHARPQPRPTGLCKHPQTRTAHEEVTPTYPNASLPQCTCNKGRSRDPARAGRFISQRVYTLLYHTHCWQCHLLGKPHGTTFSKVPKLSIVFQALSIPGKRTCISYRCPTDCTRIHNLLSTSLLSCSTRTVSRVISRATESVHLFHKQPVFEAFGDL